MTTATAVADWTLEQCAEYVAGLEEAYYEIRAEAGSSAFFSGFGQDGAYAAMAEVERPSGPDYLAAKARLEAYKADHSLVRVHYVVDLDDIPF
jgi:hypothetical protein